MTSTSRFGVSRRENHDASAFYDRFPPPTFCDDDDVAPVRIDRLVCGDARDMALVPDRSVALVVTSPPYFAGKAYEEALGEGGVPATYLEYLAMLRDVFAECVRTLEPGGRIAVNVANLGRKPYRSLSADVVAILQDDLRLLLRGEVIWRKARGSAGNCAWGSFQRPANPVLRDLTERVVVASKGRLDRAVPAKARARRGLPSEHSLTRDEFLEATTDVWELPAESATRVGHPAPFPPALPERLIHLYTYVDDLVLDPFMGAGTTAVAAVRTGRSYVGYDTDPAYVEAAKARVAGETLRVPPSVGSGPLAAALADGRAVRDVAAALLEECGFVDIADGGRTDADLRAVDRRGRRWSFLVAGGFTTVPSGLSRSDVLWRVLGQATALQLAEPDVPVVVVTTDLPPSPGGLRKAVGAGGPLADVVVVLDAADRARLAAQAAGGPGS